MKKLILATFASSVFISIGAQALESSADSVIAFTASDKVNIQNVDNISFSDSSDDISLDVTKTDNVCVWSRSGGYSITATTVNNEFNLISPTNTPASNVVSYDVQWDNGSGGFTNSLVHGTPSTIAGTIMNGANCAGADNAAFRLIFASSGLQTAEIGVHTDTLTFTITAP